MKTSTIALALLLVASLATSAAGQASFATASGTVTDATNAVIPGVSVVALDTATGVETEAVTNAAGAYNFAALQPGTYTFSASLPGFQTSNVTDVRLGTAVQVRVDFELEVAAVATAVEVSVSADQLLLESSPSVGDALEQNEVASLPLVTGDVLDLVRVMAGVNTTFNDVFAAEGTTFAGVSAQNINVSRDGLTVNEQRWPNGIDASTRLNPDLVGEMRLILTPVDAEKGRGSGQVEITTRSGGNEYNAALVYNVKNSAIDARSWLENRDDVVQDWANKHQYTISAGGPIRRGQTFFFALWDHQIANFRNTPNPIVLTPCARNGIFRYYDNWNNGNALQVPTGGGTPSIAVVDSAGNPMAPATNPDGTPHNGILRYASVFGPLQNIPSAPDCSDALVDTGNPWDLNRDRDGSGYLDGLLSAMPEVNNYDTGDGLNTAGHRWTRSYEGDDNLFGITDDSMRTQINLNVDHIFNPDHKVQVAYTYEWDWSDEDIAQWPNGYRGRNDRRPQVLAVNFVSTLNPSLVNEARFGMSRTGVNRVAAIDREQTREDALSVFPTAANGLPVIAEFGQGEVDFTGALVWSTRGFEAFTARDTSPRWSFGDTMSWTTGRHSFRFGGTFIVANSKTDNLGEVGGNTGNPGSYYPTAEGGMTSNSIITSLGNGNAAFATGSSPEPGVLQGANGTGNQGRMEDLLVALSGSLANTSQYRFVNTVEGAVSGEWNDPFSEFNSVRDTHQNEFSTFFKDDYKVSDNLTLNLGIRWDYYGVPYEENGLTGILEDGSAGLFSISGRSFDTWQTPGVRAAPSKLIFVGPNSPNPHLSAYKRDLNNFGPAVGFAYSLPWFGRDRTTIRGGYQVSYQGGGRGDVVGDLLTLTPGSGYRAEFEGPAGGEYFDYEDVLNGVGIPVNPPVPPITDIPFTDRDSQFNTFDSNLVSPYIQNITFAVTHAVNSRLTLDARYVGTLGRKLFGNINLNEENFLFNGLLQAFDAARRGGEAGLLDQIFYGINMGTGRTGMDPGARSGAEIVRTHPALRNNLARGLYEGLANSLSELNYSNGLNPGLPAIGSGEKGGVLRVNMPENFIHPNPQFGTTNLQTNIGHNNYHSFQGQVTLRPTYGVNLQASYTWSKNLGVSGGFTSPFDRSRDYRELRGRRHAFNTYGTFQLPIGPGQLIAGNSSGLAARLIEGWEMSWIFFAGSGIPISVVNRDMLYASGAADLVGTWDAFDGSAYVWEDGARTGDFFGGRFERTRDPQCLNSAIVHPSLQFRCNSNAIVDSTTGDIVLQHPLPGEFGSFGRNNISGLGIWSLDMSMAKRVQISEGVSMTIRVDSTNILNHPQPIGASGFFATEGPVMDVNGFSPFGSLGSKQGRREFQLKARVDF